jgi:ketosteroid isomerase-like protein
MATETILHIASKNDDVREINARYRAYCDACESNQLEKVPSFWSLPALFAVDTGEQETSKTVLKSPEDMIKLYGTLFGSSTGVNKTVIDSSEVTFYGDKLATIRTSLRHLAGGKLHDRQDAVYGCRKVDGKWVFISHLSVDVTQ